MKKRKHHYVPKCYLESWTQDGKLWCLRDGTIFNPGLEAVANRRDFYRPERLTDAEIELVREMTVNGRAKHLKKANEGWVAFFDIPFRLLDLLEQTDISDETFKRRLEATLHNFEEDYHASMEGELKAYLDSLSRGDASFLIDEKKLIAFLYILSIQLFRTAGTEIEVVRAVGKIPGVRFDAVWKVLRHVFASNLSWVLYAERSAWRLRLLRAPEGGAFVTGDEPVINILAAGLAPGVEPDELELYYPISPELAVAMPYTNDSTVNGAVVEISHEQINRLNRAIVRASHEQVFANTKCQLEEIERLA